jgi:hypothetical protein
MIQGAGDAGRRARKSSSESDSNDDYVNQSPKRQLVSLFIYGGDNGGDDGGDRQVLVAATVGVDRQVDR